MRVKRGLFFRGAMRKSGKRPTFSMARAVNDRPIREADSRGCFDQCTRPRSVRQWVTVYNALNVVISFTTGTTEEYPVRLFSVSWCFLSLVLLHSFSGGSSRSVVQLLIVAHVTYLLCVNRPWKRLRWHYETDDYEQRHCQKDAGE